MHLIFMQESGNWVVTFFLGSFDIFKCSTFGMITYIDVYLTFIRDSTAQIIVHINVHSTFLWDPTVWIIT